MFIGCSRERNPDPQQGHWDDNTVCLPSTHDKILFSRFDSINFDVFFSDGLISFLGERREAITVSLQSIFIILLHCIEPICEFSYQLMLMFREAESLLSVKD